mmetsp:Transcript_96935/g.277282  ORF Transcript_96935/g.277282 Transcript_96935/m.277282 type:complete len:531 (-) Transcript_96935:219-1811(-)
MSVGRYWGKADKKWNTPINSSVSVTLDQDDLRAITTVATSKAFTKDRLFLNGEELSMDDSKNEHANRFKTCVAALRAKACDRVDPATGEVLIKAKEWANYKVHVVSMNTFPTAAGLASSAAGYACLVFALSKLFCCKESPNDLSVVARQGSGSACRSLFGGFVRWNKGCAETQWEDSRAEQVATKEDWPDLATLIMVVNDGKKDTSSTTGMGTSVKTSKLLEYRATLGLVDERLEQIEAAYKKKDFDTFGQLTMADSNQFHATCLDTYPPIFYMNDTSKAIVQLVHVYNKYFDPEGGGLVKLRAAYTFDAGPNAVIFCRKEHQLHLLAFLLRYFPTPTGASATYSNKPEMLTEGAAMPVEEELLRMGDATGRVSATNSHTGSGSTKQSLVGDVKMVYCTGVGDGPRVLGADEGLVNLTDGTPKPMPPKPAPVSRDASASAAAEDESQSQFKPVWVTSLEKTIKDNHRDMKELIKPTGPSIPSTYQMITGVIKFSALYVAFYGGLGLFEMAFRNFVSRPGRRGGFTRTSTN